MNELEVLEALLAGEVVLAKRIDGSASNYKYRIINESNNRELQCYSFAYSTKYEPENFKALLYDFEYYKYSIYKEKPQLKWEERLAPSYATDSNHHYYIARYDDQWLLTFEPISANVRKILGVYDSYELCKQTAQKHSEGNN